MKTLGELRREAEIRHAKRVECYHSLCDLYQREEMRADIACTKATMEAERMFPYLTTAAGAAKEQEP